MSVNSPSATNDSLLHPNLSSINSYLPSGCFYSSPSNFMYFVFFITFILLLLPLCIFVLYLVHPRWRQQRSTSTSVAMSHSDSFSFHMVIVELAGVLGAVLCCCGIYMYHENVFSVGYMLYTFKWFGELYLHILICIERYLAVVHPIIYLSLRRDRGVRIRNIIIGFVWLLSSVGISLMNLDNVSLVMYFCVIIFCLTVVVFCSLSVLCVLIRPGPGKQGEDRQRIDQTKQKAFYTIVTILVVVIVKCLWNLVWCVYHVTGKDLECVTLATGVWLNLPCSLLLPLLFLHRAGRLACCKNNTK